MKSDRLSVAAGTGQCLVARPQLTFTFNACSVLFTICVAEDKIEEASCSLGSAFFFLFSLKWTSSIEFSGCRISL